MPISNFEKIWEVNLAYQFAVHEDFKGSSGRQLLRNEVAAKEDSEQDIGLLFFESVVELRWGCPHILEDIIPEEGHY